MQGYGMRYSCDHMKFKMLNQVHLGIFRQRVQGKYLFFSDGRYQVDLFVSAAGRYLVTQPTSINNYMFTRKHIMTSITFDNSQYRGFHFLK